MNYIKRFPYILAAFLTLIIGAAGISNGNEVRDIYIGMLVSIVVFLIIGFLLRRIVVNIYEESMFSKQQKEALLKAEKENISQNENKKGSTIDLKIDDSIELNKYDEEFTPLKVSEVISKKIKDI